VLVQSAPLRGRFLLKSSLLTLGCVFFLGGWLAPNHYPPWASFHNEAAIFAALVVFCFAASFEPKSVRLPLALLGLIAALIALVLLQWGAGLIAYSGDALLSSIYLFGFGLAWWLGARAVFAVQDPEQAVINFSVVILMAASASTMLAMLQWLRLETALGIFAAERGPFRPFANIAQPNLLATLLVIATVAANFLYFKKRINTWQLTAFMSLFAFGLTATESRAGLLSAFCVGSFALIRSRPSWQTIGWRAVSLWWATLTAMSMLWAPLNEALLLQGARKVELGVDNIRLDIWKQVTAAIVQAPWFGYGWRQTIVAQKTGVDSHAGTAPTDYAHNLILDLVAWVGLPLGIGLLSLAIWWFARTIWKQKNATELMLFAMTIPVLVHSMLEFPFAYAFFLFPVAWLMGNLHARQMPSDFVTRESIPVAEKALVFAAILGFSILCGQIAREYLEAEEDCRVMRFEMRKVGTRPLDYEAPRLTLLNQLGEMLNMGRLKPQRQMPLEDIERMRKANASLAWGAVHLNYVIALALNGQPAEAKRQLLNLGALYGPETYRSAIAELRSMRDEKYPELSALVLP
jgi:Virulence factor membrane-bound polymerase, C-terminal/O-Antigen ligase